MKNLFLLLTAIFLVVSCKVTDELTQKASSISYLVNEYPIQLGQAASSAVPTVEGASPFTFSIAKITSTDDSHLLDPDAITINSATGIISISDNNELPIGDYVLDIAVSNVGGTSVFNDVFKFIIITLPSELTYDPNLILVEEGEDAISTIPTIKGQTPFTFSIKNIMELGSFITINAENGIISIDGIASIVGDYKVDIEVTNDNGTSLFTNAYTVNITSRYDLTDGFYIAKADVDPTQNALLKSALVDGPSFTAIAREGFFSTYMYLTAGNYNLVEIEAKAIANILGGSKQQITDGDAECDVTGYFLIDAEIDGASFLIDSDGLYVLAYDAILGEIVFDQIENTNIIGSAAPGGWAVDSQLIGTVNADGGSSTIENIVLDIGQIKFRLNCRWAIDRRIDKGADFDNANGYSLPTNFGGSFDQLYPGHEAGNIEITERAVYSISATWDPSTGFSATLTKTGEAPEEPLYPTELYMVGGALGGWDWDLNGIQMIPVSQNPHLFWRIVWIEALAVNEGIKFSSELNWNNDFGSDNNISPIDGIYTVGSDNVPPPVTSGYYMVVVNLEDQTIEINEPLVYGIGDAFGGWFDATPAYQFTVDNINEIIISPNFVADEDLRMHVAAATLKKSASTLPTEWWQVEFSVISGEIKYRGTGNDLPAAPVTNGGNVSLNFKNGTGSIQ